MAEKGKQIMQQEPPAKDQPMVDPELELGEDISWEDHFVSKEEFIKLASRIDAMGVQMSLFTEALTEIKNQLSLFTHKGELEKLAHTPPHIDKPMDSRTPSSSKDVAVSLRESPLTIREPHLKPRDNPVFKDLKPPQFNGEERDRNKDTIFTFLQKWEDLHKLKNTPPECQVLEVSLSLGPKAYKWWRTLEEANRLPETWAQFETIFLKEFLPENLVDS